VFKKNSVRVIVEKKYKLQDVEGSGVPVLNKGRKIPKGDAWLCLSTDSLHSNHS
jgi:hypothetical protein